SRAHDPGARTASKQQIECVREHGLARPGLAGEYVQAGRQRKLRPLDQQQVLDTQLQKHSAGVPPRTAGSPQSVQRRVGKASRPAPLSTRPQGMAASDTKLSDL